MVDTNPDPDMVEFEAKAKELTTLLLKVCEKRLLSQPGKTSRDYLALAASAVALKKALDAFLAVEQACDE